jgi:hypothetical protein
MLHDAASAFLFLGTNLEITLLSKICSRRVLSRRGRGRFDTQGHGLAVLLLLLLLRLAQLAHNGIVRHTNTLNLLLQCLNLFLIAVISFLTESDNLLADGEELPNTLHLSLFCLRRSVLQPARELHRSMSANKARQKKNS